jgi:hypothetical protein
MIEMMRHNAKDSEVDRNYNNLMTIQLMDNDLNQEKM